MHELGFTLIYLLVFDVSFLNFYEYFSAFSVATLGNLKKLIDWQLPTERTSGQCWKQNVGNSGLVSH